jgi:phosphohistidine swiveling domain-containing protein
MARRRFNEESWFNWEQPAVPLFLDLTFEACADEFRRIFGFPFFTSVLFYRDEGEAAKTTVASWLLRYDEGVAVGRLLVDRLMLPSFAAEFEVRWEHACSELLGLVRLMRSEPGDELERIASFSGAFLRYYALGSITEPVQWYCEEEIRRWFRSPAGADLSAKLGFEADEAAAALYTMSGEPYAFTIERSLLKLAIGALGQEVEDAAVAAHAERYHWKANNYARVHDVTAASVRAEVEELARSGPSDRLTKLEEQRRDALARRAMVLGEVPLRIRRLSMLADEFGSGLADARKAVMNESLSGLAASVSRVAEHWEIPMSDVLMIGPNELEEFAEDRTSLGGVATARRLAYVQTLAPSPLDDAEMAAALSSPTDSSFVIPRQEAVGTADGKGAIELLEELDLHMALFEADDAQTGVRGEPVIVAGLDVPSISGPARVIVDPISQLDEFRDGEILLASSTTPDYVPLMRRAAAIVTNMGGMLQHAAHFAREERKPCVVGTGFATSAFATGDRVTIDLVTGRVALSQEEESR